MKRNKPLKRSSFKRKKPSQKPKTARKRAKTKKPSIRLLRDKLNRLQKEYVINKYGRDCYTCDQKDLVGANCQLGHVPWPKSILSTECRFSYEYTRIQCFSCNIHKGGMGAVAYERMLHEGIDLKELKQRNDKTKGLMYRHDWYQAKIEEYRAIHT